MKGDSPRAGGRGPAIRGIVDAIAAALLAGGLMAGCGDAAGRDESVDGGSGVDASSVLCRSDRECSPHALVCDVAVGRCVQCLAEGDCGQDEACRVGRCEVVTPCSSSRTCPGLVCDTERGYCVECVTEVDCFDEEVCRQGYCVPPPTSCVSDRECSGIGLVCDTGPGHCVECIADPDCGPGRQCDAARTCRLGDPDAGPPDTGPPDAGSVDAGTPDRDSGTIDAGPADAGGGGPLTVSIIEPTDGSTLTATDDCDPSAGGLQVRVRAVSNAPDASPGRIRIGAGAEVTASVVGGVLEACVDAPEGADVALRVIVTTADGSVAEIISVEVRPGACSPTVGALAISEVMIRTQTGFGDAGEWFELVNLAGCELALGGVRFEASPGGAGRSHTLPGVSLPAGGRLVLAYSGDSDLNHGLPVDYVYGDLSPDLVLSNGEGTLTLYTGAGTPIHQIMWTSIDHRLAVARQLGAGAAPSEVDALASWCDAIRVYSTGDGSYAGTPGEVNDPCR